MSANLFVCFFFSEQWMCFPRFCQWLSHMTPSHMVTTTWRGQSSKVMSSTASVLASKNLLFSVSARLIVLSLSACFIVLTLSAHFIVLSLSAHFIVFSLSARFIVLCLSAYFIVLSLSAHFIVLSLSACVIVLSLSARFIVLCLSARFTVLAPSAVGNGVTFPEKWLAIAHWVFPVEMQFTSVHVTSGHGGNGVCRHGAVTVYCDLLGSPFKLLCSDSEIIMSHRWSPQTVLHLAAMFNDVPLSSEELRFVLEKIIRQFDDLDLRDIPSLVYQMLLLSEKVRVRKC